MNELGRRVGTGLAGLMVAVSGCGPIPEGASGEGGQPPAKIVFTAPVQELNLTDEVELSAEVAAWAAVTVTAEAAGRVVRLPVDAGDRVGAGDLLAGLDDGEARARVAQADAARERASVALEQADRDLARGRRLAETDDIAIGDLDALELARNTGAAQVKEADAVLELARESLADMRLRAPFAGTVSERFVEVGSWVGPGSPVFRLVNHDRVKVRAAASQDDRGRLRRGLRVRVQMGANPRMEFAGRIRVLGTEADAATGTYLVEARVDAPVAASGLRLLPGMRGAMVIVVDESVAVCAPRAALVDGDDGSAVFVADGGVVRRVLPELGRMTPQHAEVLSGLGEGDVVVIQGQHVLADGDRVEVRER